MPHHLLVLAPYAALAGFAPALPLALTDRPDLTVTWRPIPVAMSADGGFVDAATEDVAVMAAAQNEAGSAYDAVVVDSTGDGGVAALRSVLDLLVMGSGKTAALHALTLGARFSFLVHSRAACMRLRSELRQWQLESHCASVRLVSLDNDAVRDAAQRCVAEDGAEVICLGNRAFSSFAPSLAELGVPVIDPLPLTCEVAVALLAAGLTHSRVAAPAPRVAKLTVLDAMANVLVAPA